MLKKHLEKSPFRTLDMMRLLVTVWSIVVGLILKVVIRFLHNFHELFRPMMPKQYVRHDKLPPSHTNYTRNGGMTGG